MAIPCYIFDIDSTLANNAHRLHHIEKTPKDWEAFYEACDKDVCIPAIVTLARNLLVCAPLFYVTGRPERTRKKTWVWLQDLRLFGSLYMRKDGDYREDFVVKAELLQQIRDAGFDPTIAFEDRDSCVKMFREHGVACAQVCEGTY